MVVFALLPRSLKFRMTAVVVMLVLFAAVIIAWVALALAERDMKSVIGNQQYALLSTAAAQIDAQIDAKKTLLASLAEAMPAGDAPLNIEGLRDFVAVHKVARKEFVNVYIFNRHGILIHTDGESAAELLLDSASLGYLERALAAGRPDVTPPFRSALTRRPTIMILQPVFDKRGRAVMLLGGSLDLNNSAFLSQIAAQKPGKTGYIFIMTTNGILLHHPNTARLLEHINARPGVNLATEMALKGFEGWTEALNKDGSEGIYSYKRLASTNWIIGARFPVDEAFAPMIAMRKQAILAAAGFAALAGLMAWFAIEVLFKPLHRLHRSISDIRSGKSGIEVLQRGRRDEIGELSGAFHELMAERETAQAALQEREAAIRSILQHAPDAFVSCSKDGLITKWNAAAEATFGWSAEEALGRDLGELIIPPSQRAQHLESLRQFARDGANPLANARIRVTTLHRDGHEVPVELSLGALPMDDKYYATAFLRDITERVLYEQKIAASEKRLRTIADSIPAMVAYIDRDLRYRFTNAHFRTLMNVDPQTLIGKTIAEGFGDDFARELALHCDEALCGEPVHYERESLQNGRRWQTMADLIPDMGADGVVAGFYLMVVDITERKNAELRQAASEKRLKLLTDNLPVLISYLDHERRFQFLNATFRHWFGMDPARLVGRRLEQGIGRDYYQKIEAHLDQAYHGQITTNELRAQIDGSRHTLETTFVPELDAAGAVIGIYSLTHDTTRMKDIEKRLMQQARVDTLTGIANRLMFEEILELALARVKRNRKPLALAYLDLDDFKTINDSMGHGSGDIVLKEFAARLVGNVRVTDTVARLAGDEFVIIFEQVNQAGEAALLAAKIVEAVRRPFTLNGAPKHITTSMGVALHEGDGETAAELLARADSALYSAKRNGRDGYVISD